MQGTECLPHRLIGEKRASFQRLACNLPETDLKTHSGKTDVMREYAGENQLTISQGCTDRSEFIARLNNPHNEGMTAVIIYGLTLQLRDGDTAKLQCFMTMLVRDA